GDEAARFRLFDPDDPEEPPPSMWASHPPNVEREESAKAIYVPCAADERSAWELFADPLRLRRALTKHVVERWSAGRPIELRPAAEVQRFIDDERAETSFDPRYHDAYEGRFIEPGDLDEVFDEEDPGPLEELLAREEALYGEELAAVMASHRQHLEE